MLSQPAHALSSQDVVQELGSDIVKGLTQEEAVNRLAQFGPNSFGEEKKINPLKILFAQIFNAMTLVSRLLACVSAMR